MKNVRIASRTSTSPLGYPQTVRSHDLTILTSLPAGKMVPLAAIPLLREDSARVRLSMALQMMETVELLVNEVNVSVKAYLVPNLAFERFQSMDDLNRSWEGQPPRPGMPVIPFIERIAAKAPGADKIMLYLGKHAKEGALINSAYHEAYNEIWNFRAKNRSANIGARARLQDTLAPAFWHHSRFNHIVPDFDQAAMEGEVALQALGTTNRIPIRGMTLRNVNAGDQSVLPASANARGQQMDGKARDPLTGYNQIHVGQGSAGNTLMFDARNGALEVYAELTSTGVTMSLANIELAKRTQAFAKLRAQYAGHDDDYIIDMLMDGLTIPDQAWRQPILLQERATIFGLSKRYATSGGDLTESVVNGATMIDLNFAAPRCPMGGIIMVVAEVTPGQLFERGRDPYLFVENTEQFPHALRDTLDPEKVVAVRNDYIDIDHSTPAGTFGYAPLNHEWTFTAPSIGGRFHRPKVDAAFDEDRQRIWAVETKDPVLSQDFYLCTTMHTKPFVNPGQDPFELTATGGAAITGNTQFGAVLVEASKDFKEVSDDTPKDRIVKTPPARNPNIQ